ncbi:MAG: GNAT family N-acetyltransferase [Pseudomonadota bacterium]
MPFSVRPATEADIPALASIHIASKRAAEKHIVPDDYLNSFTQEEYEEKWVDFYANGQQLIVDDEEKAVGFVSYGDLRTPPPGTSKIRPLYIAEIYAIYVVPEYFGQGAGHALFHATCQALVNNKKHSLCLWALEKNKRAREFYERQGAQRIGKQNIETGGVPAREICYGWRDIRKI